MSIEHIQLNLKHVPKELRWSSNPEIESKAKWFSFLEENGFSRMALAGRIGSGRLVHRLWVLGRYADDGKVLEVADVHCVCGSAKWQSSYCITMHPIESVNCERCNKRKRSQ